MTETFTLIAAVAILAVGPLHALIGILEGIDNRRRRRAAGRPLIKV